MIEHTKEPWHVGAQNDALYIIAGSRPADGNDYLVHDADRTVIAGMQAIGHERNYVNARRIVACVNACATLSTGVLEKHIGKGVFEILTEMTAQRDRLLSLAKQAGKELAAVAEDLKKCSTIDGDWGNELDAKEEYDRLMALTAELEGGAA